MLNKKPMLGVFIMIINGTLQSAPALPEVSESVQKIYQAARTYDAPGLKQHLGQVPRSERTQALCDAKEYAIAVSDAQTTRNLTEKWLESKRDFSHRHPYLTSAISLPLAWIILALGENMKLWKIS